MKFGVTNNGLSKFRRMQKHFVSGEDEIVIQINYLVLLVVLLLLLVLLFLFVLNPTMLVPLDISSQRLQVRGFFGFCLLTVSIFASPVTKSKYPIISVTLY